MFFFLENNSKNENFSEFGTRQINVNKNRCSVILIHLNRLIFFQSMISYSSNPNNWELPNGVEISSQVTNVYFTNTSSAAINLTDLTEPIVAAFRSPLGDASARRKRRSTDDDNGESAGISI